MTTSGWLWGVVATLVDAHLVAFVVFHCLRRPRDPRSALLWIFVSFAFPFFGFLLFVIFGINRIPAKRWKKKVSDRAFWDALSGGRATEADTQPIAYWRGLARAPQPVLADAFDRQLNQVLDRCSMRNPLLGGNDVMPLVDGTAAYPEMLAAIRGATHHIHLQSYIIAPDAVGRAFMEALCARARAGVRVRILYDAYGSRTARLRGFFRRYQHVPNLSVVGFTQANILKRQFQLNLRNHRKIMVVDGTTAFVGGMNLSAGNLGVGGTARAIHDLHFRVRGPAVVELQYTFLRDWYYMTDEDADVLLSRAAFPATPPAGRMALRVMNAGPTVPEVIDDAFFNLICGAKDQILLLTPYFIPPEELLSALRSAALRGVDVKIILPAHGNQPIAHYAARTAFEYLLTAGVRIFERKPPFAHTKLLVADGRIVMLGSANFDNRSIHLNYETSVLVFDESFAQTMKAIVYEDLVQSVEVALATWQRRTTWPRLRENFCALFAPVL